LWLRRGDPYLSKREQQLAKPQLLASKQWMSQLGHSIVAFICLLSPQEEFILSYFICTSEWLSFVHLALPKDIAFVC